MLSSILALFLAIAPEPSADYADARAHLDETSLAAANSVDPQVLAALADALAQMDTHALALADDEAGRRGVIMARLNLARGYLKAGDSAAAERELDRLLRESLGAEVPSGRFGPDIDKLFASRKAALDAAGKGTLSIACVAPCEVVIDTTRVEPGEHELYLGAHSLQIHSTDGNSEPLAQTVELTEPGAAIAVEYGNRQPPGLDPDPEPAAPPPTIEPEPAPVVPPQPKRMLSRGVEIDGVILGTGLVVAGVIMFALDENCVNRDADPEFCGRRWEGTAGGAVTVGLGSALLITSAVLLAVDERRVKAQRDGKPTARLEFGRLRF
jgi:hypothetical protein